MNKNGGVRIKRLHACQRLGFEFVVHNAGPLPAEDVSACLLLNIIAEMSVRCPDNFLPQAVQMLNQLNGDAGGHDPVCPRFYRRGGVGINHHGTVRMGVAEGGERVNRAAKIERTLGIQRRHQNGFFRAENFRRFAHKTHASNKQRGSRMFCAKARHLQRVRDAAPGLFRQLLDFRVGVVMRHHHRVSLFQKTFDLLAVELFFVLA